MRGTVCVLWVGLILVAGCDHGGREERAVQDDRTVPPTDPWLRLPSIEFVTSAKELDRAEFAAVTTKEAQALGRLKDSACVELRQREAEELAGGPVGGKGGRLVLLRGLSSDTPHGAFTLSWQQGAVRVNHGRLGRHPLPIVRRAVVARLPELPAEVFVDLCMAE